MLTNAAKQEIANFFTLFVTNDLYDAGFGDTVSQTGSHLVSERDIDVALAMAYVSGAAATARLANTYMTPQWSVCEIMERASGMLLSLARGSDTIDAPAVARLCYTWAAEIRHELARKAA